MMMDNRSAGTQQRLNSLFKTAGEQSCNSLELRREVRQLLNDLPCETIALQSERKADF